MRATSAAARWRAQATRTSASSAWIPSRASSADRSMTKATLTQADASRRAPHARDRLHHEAPCRGTASVPTNVVPAAKVDPGPPSQRSGRCRGSTELGGEGDPCGCEGVGQAGQVGAAGLGEVGASAAAASTWLTIAAMRLPAGIFPLEVLGWSPRQAGLAIALGAEDDDARAEAGRAGCRRPRAGPGCPDVDELGEQLDALDDLDNRPLPRRRRRRACAAARRSRARGRGARVEPASASAALLRTGGVELAAASARIWRGLLKVRTRSCR